MSPSQRPEETSPESGGPLFRVRKEELLTVSKLLTDLLTVSAASADHKHKHTHTEKDGVMVQQTSLVKSVTVEALVVLPVRPVDTGVGDEPDRE